MSTGKCPYTLFYDLGEFLNHEPQELGWPWEMWARWEMLILGGTGHHLSLDYSCHRNELLKSTCTLSPRGVFVLVQCTSNALQGKMQSVGPIFGRIITAKIWNLCHAADLWNIRWYMETTIKNPLKFYKLFLVFFFIKYLYASSTGWQNHWVSELQAFQTWLKLNARLRTSRCSLTHTATWKPGVHRVSAVFTQVCLPKTTHFFTYLNAIIYPKW